MQITHKDLKQIVDNLLNILDKEEISTSDDLAARIGQSFPIDNSEDFVIISKREPNILTPYESDTISYIRPGAGVPLEIKMCKQAGYSLIILKNNDILPGYKVFLEDLQHNNIQYKKINSSKLESVREEIETHLR